MSAPAAPTAAPTPKKGRKLMLLVVGVVFAGAGAAIPMFVNVPALFAKPKADKGKGHGEGKTVVVPFSDVVVNLVDPRMQRYLRVKIAVLVDAEAEEEVTELLTKHKATVKSKLIGHLAGKEIKDVSGTVGVNRLQRELLERFEDVLYPDGHSQIRNILFEEYVIQ
ncbi:MAG TPA: flagellar basal body-associated FliL family protein [Gemmata sp.]|jgi:flagellar basal body-associated protein FliL|nr:flagellar basal body-associated FliL family protein [Gemmata sp.]